MGQIKSPFNQTLILTLMDRINYKAKYKISVFREMGLKILGRVGTYTRGL